MIRKNIDAPREQIVREYLNGDQTMQSLGKKYGVNPRTIQSWVRYHRKHIGAEPLTKNENGASVLDLKRQLKEAQMKNELLEEILRLSEIQTGIDLRKKTGAKRS